MANPSSYDMYPECTNHQRASFEDSPEVQAFALSQSKGVLPLFEHIMRNYKEIKVLSLQTNELLQCRWRSYVKNGGKRTSEPYQFPDINHLHLHKCIVTYMPSLSHINSPNIRMKMSPGPGVDHYGQKPIPNDMHVRKREPNKPVASSKARKQ